MSNDKHTPTPWHVEAFEVYDTQGLIIADCGLIDDLDIVEANAAQIVQCVNEYDGLIETISTLRAEKAELIEALRGILEANESEDFDLTQTVDLMIGIASQILAKLETK